MLSLERIDLSQIRSDFVQERPAIEIGARTYGSIKTILDNNLDRRPASRPRALTIPTINKARRPASGAEPSPTASSSTPSGPLRGARVSRRAF